MHLYGTVIAWQLFVEFDPAAPAGKKFYGWMNTKNGGQIWTLKPQTSI
jgi:hypothetical protein